MAIYKLNKTIHDGSNEEGDPIFHEKGLILNNPPKELLDKWLSHGVLDEVKDSAVVFEKKVSSKKNKED